MISVFVKKFVECVCKSEPDLSSKQVNNALDIISLSLKKKKKEEYVRI